MPKTSLSQEGRQVAALPWRATNGALEFLLVTSRISQHWLIPKGWPMPGKSDRDSALQEAFEEAGIRGVGSRHALGHYPFQKAMHDGSELSCVMSVFGMSGVTELDSWPEMEQRERRWVAQFDAIEMIFDWNLTRFLADITLERLERSRAVPLFPPPT
jgi:8-oxo-dGTP pyrophosphatase MutT (NUDIX family)